MRAYAPFPRLLSCILIFISLAGCDGPPATPAVATRPLAATPAATRLPAYWPTHAWRRVAPEQAGMDSGRLADMLAEMEARAYPIRGLVVLRHGYVVLEAYQHPFDAETRSYLYSAAKSFTGAMMGIAIQNGWIRSVQQRVADFFPQRAFANPSPAKQAVTLEHLLTMSSGLVWPNKRLEEPMWDTFWASRDHIQFAFDPPVEEPGAQFHYNSAGVYLLSAVIWQASGRSMGALARQLLFEPMGVTDVSWLDDPAGITMGCSGLELTALDLAKFGELYLRGGNWEGQQLVPAEWVRTSITPHIATPIMAMNYGYLFYVDAFGNFNARGAGGQRLWVDPGRDLVVAVISDFTTVEGMEYVPDGLIGRYIQLAVGAEEPLPPNPAAQARLERLVQARQHPQPKAVPPMPPIAAEITGRTYRMEPNGLNSRTLSLRFTGEQAYISGLLGNVLVELPVGLDDVYRISHLKLAGSLESTYALKGAWTGANQFTIQATLQRQPARLILTFTNAGLSLEILSGSNREVVAGRPD